jgi:preprotein translocase subunit SecG
MKKFTAFLFMVFILLFLNLSLAEAQQKPKTRGRNPEKELFGKSRRVKVVESRGVRKKKKEQGKKEAKIKKDYNKFVEASRKRAYQIQSPEVKKRMKQNKKEIAIREKENRKKNNASTRSGAKKYK